MEEDTKRARFWKWVVIILGIVIIILFVCYFFFDKKVGVSDSAVKTDYKSLTYTVDGIETILVNGVSEKQAAPGSASVIKIEYFGNEVYHDVNNDGLSDVVFLLTQTGVGSGTFYYVVVALKTEDGYQGTNAVFLGDRIAPQTTLIKDGIIVVNYADRKQGEAMTVVPSVGISKYLKIDNGKLVEVNLN